MILDTIDHVECARTIARFFRALDTGDHEQLVLQMCPGGVWFRKGERLAGRDAILDALRSRPADRLTRHLATNIVSEEQARDLRKARCTVLTFAADTRMAGAVPEPLPASILDYEDILERQPDGRWLIAERRSARIFSATP
ncbi:MAG: nuclear transport factor 2 family protein [Rhodobacteraceae bacterium]|nr:nuclear transport factor 2 family protein [Paracoccaceae bacterium]